MDELYAMMRKKLMKYYDGKRKDGTKKDRISFTFAEFSKLYAIVCYMRQIHDLLNGVDRTVKGKAKDEDDD